MDVCVCVDGKRQAEATATTTLTQAQKQDERIATLPSALWKGGSQGTSKAPQNQCASVCVCVGIIVSMEK